MKPLHKLKQVAFTDVMCVGEAMAMDSMPRVSPLLSWPQKITSSISGGS